MAAVTREQFVKDLLASGASEEEVAVALQLADERGEFGAPTGSPEVKKPSAWNLGATLKKDYEETMAANEKEKKSNLPGPLKEATGAASLLAGTARAAGDIITYPFRGAAESLGIDKWPAGIAKAVANIPIQPQLNPMTGAVQPSPTVGEALAPVGEAAAQWVQDHPDAARRLGYTVDIASALPAGKAAKVASEAAKIPEVTTAVGKGIRKAGEESLAAEMKPSETLAGKLGDVESFGAAARKYDVLGNMRDIANKAENKIQVLNKSVNKALSAAPDMDFDQIVDEVRTAIKQSGKYDKEFVGSKDAAERILDNIWMDYSTSGKTGTMKATALNDIKKDMYKSSYKPNDMPGTDPLAAVDENVRKVLAREINERLKKAAPSIKQSLTAESELIPLSQAANKASNRIGKFNPIWGLLTIGGGVAAVPLGAVIHGAEGAATAGAVVVASEALRRLTRGGQASSLLINFGKTIEDIGGKSYRDALDKIPLRKLADNPSIEYWYKQAASMTPQQRTVLGLALEYAGASAGTEALQGIRAQAQDTTTGE